jgi:hypothetical protein
VVMSRHGAEQPWTTWTPAEPLLVPFSLELASPFAELCLPNAPFPSLATNSVSSCHLSHDRALETEDSR